MFDLPIGAMLEAMNSPQVKHAAMVHLPIAIGMLGLLGMFAFAVSRGRSRTLRRCCVAMYLVGALFAKIAQEAGEDAVASLDTTVMTQAVLERIETHESMGERVWMWLLVTAVATAGTGFVAYGSRLQEIVLAMAVLAALGAALYISVTAYHGGALVYEHAVGVPTVRKGGG